VKFYAGPDRRYKTPRVFAIVLVIAAVAYGLDALVFGKPLTYLTGPGLLLLAAGYLWFLRGGATRPVDAAEEVDEGAPPDEASMAGGKGAFPLRGRQGGFTLIEMLMTVAITALVFSMIGGILLSVISASEKIELKLRTEKKGYGVLGVLRRDLTGVYAYGLGPEAFKGEDKSVLGKEADELHFVTTANVVETEDGQRPKLVEVGYRFDSGEGDDIVMFRRAAPLEGNPLGGEGDYVEILAGIQSFHLEYLNAETEQWVERWEQEEDLPKAVKVKVELRLDEAQQRVVEAGALDIPNPTYEMIVGLPARTKLPEDPQQGQGQGEGDN